jgi:hypothetical protein
MADKEKKKVYVELYDSQLTPRKDDRTGRVLNGGSAAVDDLIGDVKDNNSEINPIILRASYDVIKSAAMSRILLGQRVEFGLGVFYLESAGSFIGDAAKWDKSKNRLIVKALPSKEIRERVKSIEVEVLGMARVPNMISSVTDVFSGQENVCLTRGGMAHINGAKIKIAGSSPEVGLKLLSQPDGSVWDIPLTSIGINDPSRVSFVIPADLPVGEYLLNIVTQYSGGGNELKNPRTLALEYLLMVE